MSSVCDENHHISNASYELLSNIVNCDKVLEDIYEKKAIRNHIIKCFNIANLYLQGDKKVNGGKVTLLKHEDTIHKFPTCINILCIVCILPG